MPEPRRFDVHVVSHTHWDREWYLPAGRFRQRLVALIDELLSAPQQEGSFLLDGQTILLEDYLDVRPERREELATRLRDGTLEAGPWYVLADELIASGESLVRNLLAGRRTLRELGAEAPRVLYSPDAFGHPATLPILANGFGCPIIILWRGMGGEAWPAGDTFRWDAPDGTSLLVHHLPPDGYGYGANLPATAPAARAFWEPLRRELASRARLDVLLVLNGADHHRRQAALDEALSCLTSIAEPDLVIRSSLGAFAREVVDRAPRAEIPRIRGEMRDSYGYAWTLQGTLASRAHLKRWNARVERALIRDAEPWAALAARQGGTERGHLLHAAWKSVLQCHPHDTLCGCSVDDVARAMATRLAEAEAQAEGIREDALSELASHDPAKARTARGRWQPIVLLRNPAPRARGGVAEIEIALFRQDVPVGPGSGSAVPLASPEVDLFALEGGSVPYQVLGRLRRHDRVESPRHYPDNDLVDVVHAVAWVPSVDGYGTRPLTIDRHAESRAVALTPVECNASLLDNGTLRVELKEDGTATLRAHDASVAISPLLRFEDVGDAGDLYTHSPIEPVVDRTSFLGARLVHAGPLRGEIEARWRLEVPATSSRMGRSTSTVPHEVRVSLSLDAAADFLRVRVAGENAARDHRLRIVVATGIANGGGAVHADAAFGSVRRQPIVASPSARRMESPPPTAPLARYVTVSSATRGVTVFSDGLAEYEVTTAGDVAITLLRAVGELSRVDLPERPGHAGWPVPTPEAQCLGAFEASFAIFPHGARDEDVLTAIERTADDVLLPVSGATLRSALAVPAPTRGVTLEGAALAFSACKESEDGEWLVLRCVNLSDRAGMGRWRCGFTVREARRARIDETPMEAIPVADDTIEFEAKASAVVTVLVR